MAKKPRKPSKPDGEAEIAGRADTGETEDATGSNDGTIASDQEGNNAGRQHVTASPASMPPVAGEGGEIDHAHARDGETRNQAWERIRQEGRSAGMGKREAYDRATREATRLFPPVVESEPEAEELEPVEPEPVAAVELAPVVDDSGVSGLGRLPPGWPRLPSNASLQAEIAWVQASRLDVVEETAGGTVVDLGRADTPAPSKAAIGWLETSIRAYSKYCDIAAKATQTQEHEAEAVRRERLALGDVIGLLDEMGT